MSKKRKKITDEQRTWAVNEYIKGKITKDEIIIKVWGQPATRQQLYEKRRTLGKIVENYQKYKDSPNHRKPYSMTMVLSRPKRVALPNSVKEDVVKRYLNKEATVTDLVRELWGTISRQKLRSRRAQVYQWVERYKELGNTFDFKRQPPSTDIRGLFTVAGELWAKGFKQNNFDDLISWFGGLKTSTKVRVVSYLFKKQDKFSLTSFLKLLDFSKSTYYYKNRGRYETRGRKPLKRDESLKRHIKKIWEDSERVYGRKKITSVLNNKYNIEVSEWVVYEIMKKMNIKSLIRNPKYKREVKNTEGGFDNIISRNFKAEREHQKWFTDVSYIFVNAKLYYLSIIIDTFNNEIVAYEFDDNQRTPVVMSNLRKAYKNVQDKEKTIILHSDHGYQYTSAIYIKYCEEHNIVISQSRVADHLDNRPAEYFFSVIKQECVRFFGKKHINTFDKAKKEIQRFMRYYNSKRIQLCLEGMTPAEWKDKKNKEKTF